ncbi:hypothetical protein [Actinocorallia longicatena]|uniref:4-amino-4-deoxychorismate synthase n=1 Tax=Actinocorallia longicatena TaxID=111803 RepID=A0ABP6QLJ0_9ACTN
MVEDFSALAARVLSGPARCGPVRLVAVDGPGGAGKSTFAGRLASALGGAPLVHTDDFASAEDPLGWWDRFEAQVLAPLGNGRPGRFQRHDWERGELAEWHDVPVVPCVVVEGVSSARRVVAGRLTLAIWIETGRDERLRRGLDRDGPEALGFWRSWMAAEDRHYAADRTAERAGLVVDGLPALPHDPGRSYVRLR